MKSSFFYIEKSESHWTSTADLMSGLMIIFMFISISYMISASKERDKMRETAQDWAENKAKIYDSLFVEFKDDLPQWNAEIDSVKLIVRFKEPSVLFKKGIASLEPRFEKILKNFFPRYLKVLRPFQNSISEIRIEGHTSSEWNKDVEELEAYFRNMNLSQERTQEVLIYCIKQTNNDTLRSWCQDIILAAGFSSSRLIYFDNGVENKNQSRRVDFRVRTNADEKLNEIIGYEEQRPLTKNIVHLADSAKSEDGSN